MNKLLLAVLIACAAAPRLSAQQPSALAALKSLSGADVPLPAPVRHAPACTCFGVRPEWWAGTGRCTTYSEVETAPTCKEALTALAFKPAFSKVEWSFDADGRCNGAKTLEALSPVNCTIK